MMAGMSTIDPESAEAFVLVAELHSFTRAAQVLNTTQAAVSLKLKRLEDRLGRRLLERSPRHVRLSTDGEAFLDAARGLVAASRRAEAAFTIEHTRLTVGITHHIVGTNLPRLLRRLGTLDASLTLDIRVGETRGLLDLYDQGSLDAAIVLRHDESRRGGEVLLAETFDWFSAPDFDWPADVPLPLATQAEPCSLRAMAVRHLDAAGIAWREAFVGGGVMTIGAAAAAGLAVAAMAVRAAPPGSVEVGRRLGLPALPKRDVVLHSNVGDPRGATTLRAVAAAFRAS
jgi:DNA-binding transcriptional LysR family regulator